MGTTLPLPYHICLGHIIPSYTYVHMDKSVTSSMSMY